MCGSDYTVGDVHPATTDRINKILFQNPKIRALANCAAPQVSNYCSMSDHVAKSAKPATSPSAVPRSSSRSVSQNSTGAVESTSALVGGEASLSSTSDLSQNLRLTYRFADKSVHHEIDSGRHTLMISGDHPGWIRAITSEDAAWAKEKWQSLSRAKDESGTCKLKSAKFEGVGTPFTICLDQTSEASSEVLRLISVLGTK